MKYFKYLLILVIVVALIYCGFVIKNFPLIEWDKKIKIYEVFQVISTILIGFGIPFFIKRWIDDGRVMRNLLNDESKDILLEATKIKDIILKCFDNKSISGDDKQFINYLFTNIEILIEVFERSIKHSFDEKYNSEFDELEKAYHKYWRSVTDGDLMSDKFVMINLEFLSEFTTDHNIFINSIRKFHIQIQR